MNTACLRIWGAPAVRPLVVVEDTEHGVLVLPVLGKFGIAQYRVSLRETLDTPGKGTPVAFVHLQIGTRSKLLDTAPASVHCAYLLRDPYGPAAAHVNYLMRQSEKTQTREDLVYKTAVNLPDWANDSPAAFFASGEIHGRVNAQLGQTRTIALPRELDRTQQMTLCHDFLESQFGTKHAYAFAIHSAKASDGLQNDHMHVIYSTKILDGIDRGPEQFWKRYTPEHPARGGAQVDRWFVTRPALYAQRQAWSDCCNRALEVASSDARVSSLPFDQRGITRGREVHLDAWHPTQHKHGRGTSPQWQQRLDGQAARAAARAAEHAQAAEAWEVRKQQLSITRDMSREQFLARVHEATRAYQPPPRLTATELAVEAPRVEQQRTVVQQMEHVVVVERARRTTGRERSPATAQRQHDVWAQAQAYGLVAPPARPRIPTPQRPGHEPLMPAEVHQSLTRKFDQLAQALQPQEASQGRGVRFRFHDREHEQERDDGLSL